MEEAKYMLDDIANLYRYCKQLEDDSYVASDVAEHDGRKALSDSMFGESMAYCHIAHKLDAIITAWETALGEEN